MPDEIEFDHTEVEGLVVVGGHAQEAEAQKTRLQQAQLGVRATSLGMS